MSQHYVSVSDNMSLSELAEGRKVQLSDGREAVIRFAGQTGFAPAQLLRLLSLVLPAAPE